MASWLERQGKIGNFHGEEIFGTKRLLKCIWRSIADRIQEFESLQKLHMQDLHFVGQKHQRPLQLELNHR